MAILVVEDERDLSDLLSYILRRSGHDVITAFDGKSALRLWRESRPSLVLLDIGLPDVDGWQVCQTIRCNSATPVMIVSGADDEDDIVRGLELGAEDYVTKPFSPRLLLARINTLLRRSQLEGSPEAPPSIRINDLELIHEWRTVRCGESSVRLTRLEYRVLQELALHAGQVLPHEDLIHQVWGYKGEVNGSILKGHIHNIRLKLAELHSRIQVRVVLGVGYMLSADADVPALTHV